MENLEERAGKWFNTKKGPLRTLEKIKINNYTLYICQNGIAVCKIIPSPENDNEMHKIGKIIEKGNFYILQLHKNNNFPTSENEFQEF